TKAYVAGGVVRPGRDGWPFPIGRRDAVCHHQGARMHGGETKARMDLQVLYEDSHCVAVCKPAGILVQADRTADPTLVQAVELYLRRRYGKRGGVFIGVVHRLDRPVSGVLLLARTSKAAGRLAAQFRAGTVRKVYVALVETAPPQPEGV